MGSYFSKQKIEIKDEMSLSFLDYNNVQNGDHNLQNIIHLTLKIFKIFN